VGYNIFFIAHLYFSAYIETENDVWCQITRVTWLPRWWKC